MFPFFPKQTATVTRIDFKSAMTICGKTPKKWASSRPVKITFLHKIGLVKVIMKKTDSYHKKTIYFNIAEIASIKQHDRSLTVHPIQVTGY